LDFFPAPSKQNMSRIYGYNIPHTAIETSLEATTADGLRSIEINIPNGMPPSELFPPSRIDSIKGIAEENGATLSFHIPFKVNVSESIPSFRKANIKYLRSCIETAAALGIKLITVHLGTFYWFPVETRTRNKSLERFVQHIDEVLVDCQANDIKLALENVVPLPKWSDYHHLGDNIEDFKYIFDNVDSEHLGMCLDTGHANLGDGVAAFVESIASKIINVHIHDNPGDDDIHLLVGDGNIAWEEVTAAFLKVSYNGPFISECRNEDPAEAARRLEEYFYNASPVNT
jgi:sugar phosphate isomerase/epimerase